MTIENEKVPIKAKCEIVCPDEYDLIKGFLAQKSAVFLPWIIFQANEELFILAGKEEFGKNQKMLYFIACQKVSDCIWSKLEIAILGPPLSQFGRHGCH